MAALLHSPTEGHVCINEYMNTYLTAVDLNGNEANNICVTFLIMLLKLHDMVHCA